MRLRTSDVLIVWPWGRVARSLRPTRLLLERFYIPAPPLLDSNPESTPVNVAAVGFVSYTAFARAGRGASGCHHRLRTGSVTNRPRRTWHQIGPRLLSATLVFSVRSSRPLYHAWSLLQQPVRGSPAAVDRTRAGVVWPRLTRHTGTE